MKQRQRAVLGLGVGLIALLIPGTLPSVLAQSNPSTSQQIWSAMAAMNAVLESAGVNIRIAKADYLTPNDSGEVGQTVVFNDRNKQLPLHFVPGDPRRDGRTNITYTIDQTEGAVDGLTQAQTNAAITRAMTTWDNVMCSTIPIEQVGNPGTDIGVIEFLNGLGGSLFFFADITHAGWLPAGILPNNVIASSFFAVWVDGNGDPTDIDGNGKLDTAFTETLYNDFFVWRINANIDVETVALHESGHGLSQAHFGKAFQTTANGLFHFAPRAVMNAAYSGVQQQIAKSDLAGHCSIWASWPQN